MADQITTASKARLLRRLGMLSPGDMDRVAKAICMQLAIMPAR
jgi:mRNA-degrading endonuclease toxin of MazEF toxin-antitoxin module